MTHKRFIMAALAALAALLIIVVLAGAAIADGPVIWKQHCPRWHDVVLVPAPDWGGVHVMCIMAAEREERDGVKP